MRITYENNNKKTNVLAIIRKTKTKTNMKLCNENIDESEDNIPN